MKKWVDIGGIVLVVVLVGVGVWMMRGEGENRGRDARVPTVPAEGEKEGEVRSRAGNPAPSQDVQEEDGNSVYGADARSEENPEEEIPQKDAVDERRIRRMGKRHLTAKRADGSEIVVNPPVFKDQFNRALLAACGGGGQVSALRVQYKNLGAEAFIEKLEEEIAFEDGEDVRVARMKEATAAFKKELLEYLQSGGDFAEAMDNLERMNREDRRERVAGHIALRDFARENADDPEIVKEWVRRRNEYLREKGLREMSVPPQFNEEGNNL